MTAFFLLLTLLSVGEKNLKTGQHLMELRRKLRGSPFEPLCIYRFWHSTSAYGIAEECTELPASDHSIYRWPVDLLKPSLVVFLDVSEEERQKRIVGRQLQLTTEETQLAEDARKRQR